MAACRRESNASTLAAISLTELPSWILGVPGERAVERGSELVGLGASLGLAVGELAQLGSHSVLLSLGLEKISLQLYQPQVHVS